MCGGVCVFVLVSLRPESSTKLIFLVLDVRLSEGLLVSVQ